MLKTVLLLFLAYIAYRFLFGFVIPVTRATRQVRRQFRAAQEEMEARMREAQSTGPAYQDNTFQGTQAQRPVSKGDYLDFEEVREK